MAPAETSIYLGRRVSDGKDVSLPLDATTKNVAMEVMTGGGKTTTVQELDFVLPFEPLSMIAMDYIGTGHAGARSHKAYLGSILLLLERLYPAVFAGAAPWFLQRFAFGVISHQEQNMITIDVLKRRARPDGSLESVQEVVDRMLNVFSVRFDDMNIRLKFRQVAAAVFTVLTAAGRSLTEYGLLLKRPDDAFRNFVLREIEANGLANDEYVRHGVENLLGFVNLDARQFNDKTDSFMHAMEDYAPGTVLGRVFGSEETYDPAHAIFRGGRAFFTIDLNNETLRKESFLAIHAINAALMSLRRPGTGTYPQLHYILDEVTQWAPKSLLSLMAQGRNLKCSTWLLFQHLQQWKAAGLSEMCDIREAVCALNVYGRPTTSDAARELAWKAQPVDPMGMLQRLLLESNSTTKTTSETITESWQDAINDVEGASAQYQSGSGQSNDPDRENIRLSVSGSRSDGSSFSHGVTSSFGGSTSTGTALAIGKALTETLVRIPFGEQIDAVAQEYLRRADYELTWAYGGKAVDVRMAPPRTFPETLLGVPILDDYKRWHDGYWRSKAVARRPYEPVITLASTEPRKAASPKARATSTVSAAAATTLSPDVAATNTDFDVQPLAFPPPRNIAGDAGRLALLNTVATIRLGTIQNVMAIFQWSYDKAARELARLVESGLVEQIRPYAPRGEGSAPIIFIITVAGAKRLGDGGYDGPDLQRAAKNLSVFKRTVEANRPAQTEHRLWSATLLTLLVSSLAEEEAIITDVRFDRERSVPVNLAPYAIPERERALIGSNDAAYVPDFSFVVSRHRDGARARDVIVGEVETGFGERDQRDLAIGKAWKLRAISEEFDRTRCFDGTIFDEKSQLRVVVWTRSAAQEQKFFDGAKSVFQNVRAPFWITNGELLPLVVATGTKKRDRETAVAALVANVQERIWRWLRLPSPTDRRRFVAPELRHV